MRTCPYSIYIYLLTSNIEAPFCFPDIGRPFSRCYGFRRRDARPDVDDVQADACAARFIHFFHDRESLTASDADLAEWDVGRGTDARRRFGVCWSTKLVVGC